MADGNLIISPGEAIIKAQEMKRIADELQQLLEGVSQSMTEIDNEETHLYQGAKKPAELRAELDDFRRVFNRTYEQITKSAGDIINIANRMQAE